MIQIIHLDITPSADREREKTMRGKMDEGRMEKEKE